ncbi:MAG TPA: acyl-CoA dehydrogenase family protein [Burkholderiaceae bacterium]|nr:acyl-CoA dehydrogenase family protein [Burkholderiaceae bacterium]
MDFTFTNDQSLFRDAIRSYLMVEATPELLRSVWETPSGRSDPAFEKFAEQGLTGLSIPEAEGGLGCNELDWVLMAQELGYYGVPDSLLSTACLAVGLLTALPGDAPVRKAWLPRILAGDARIAVGHPISALVADAHVADLLLLHHAGEVHAVPRSEVDLVLNPSVDPARRLHTVAWKPSGRTRIADADAGRVLWDDMFERGALVTAAQSIGLTLRMMDLAVDYSVQRKQFGKPIGSFQAVKHLMADVAVAVEFAKPVVYRAAHALAHRLPHRAVHVSHAKLAADEAAWLAARNSIQVHGAMGYTWEVDLQIFMKRAWSLGASWGDRGLHKTRVSDFVLADGAPLGPGNTFISTNH